AAAAGDEAELGGESLSDATIEDLDGAPDLEAPCAGPDDVTLQADAVDLGELSDVDGGLDDDDDLEGGESLGVDATEPVAAAAADEEAASGEGFDLAAELSDVFDDPDPGLTGDATIGGTTQAGFESIFQSFKQGVKEQLGEGEEETHYDLGIAYREMGLFEDAIGEFRVAMTAPSRKLDCLAMMGLCALDLGRADDAVNHLEQALALPDLDDARMAGLRFDLGRAFEQKRDLDRTRELWEQVKAFDAGFQDVSERLETLGQGDSSPSLGELDPDGIDEPGEAFESFDDLIAEAEADFDSEDGDDDDDPDGGDDDANGTSQWGRKVSYG
ncbi:MAG: tetratricopeptide repeat protein, partial [Myxococcales bacterium]|nr:tetratricopeptide repeat protein [Myxococcales bacterium]